MFAYTHQAEIALSVVNATNNPQTTLAYKQQKQKRWQSFIARCWYTISSAQGIFFFFFLLDRLFSSRSKIAKCKCNLSFTTKGQRVLWLAHLAVVTLALLRCFSATWAASNMFSFSSSSSFSFFIFCFLIHLLLQLADIRFIYLFLRPTMY